MTGFARYWGQGGDRALLLHCSMAHSGAWDGVARALCDRLTLCAPDLVGHGKGPPRDAARDYHDQCTEVALAHLPDAPCHLVGHSFGATIALRLALDHPGRVRSLTLIEPVLFAAAQGGPGWQQQAAVAAQLDAAFAMGDRAAATRTFLTVWGDGQPFDSLPPAQQAYFQDRIWVVAASNAALQADSARLLPRLGALCGPVLLIEGDRAPRVIAEIQTALAAAIPQARRVVIPGAGHMAPITHPAEIAKAIACQLL